MSKPPYRVLRIVLGFLSILLAVAGILLIFSSKPLIMRMFMHPPDSEISTLLLATVQGDGRVHTRVERDALSCLPRPRAQRCGH